MKNILILSVALALFASCGNKTENKEDKKDSVSTSKDEGKPENKSEEKVEAKKLTMEDLVGTWQQTESAQNQGVQASGTLSIILNANGNFTHTVSTATNMNPMGVTMPSLSQSGKWSLNDKTVNLGGIAKLEYDEDTKTLVNVAEHVSLVRK
ncbi:MAG: hypothetical protein SGJ10_11200 [Bacteroidota bacterium]|nr:hypothetical protein [Bacteroidota bacterium]